MSATILDGKKLAETVRAGVRDAVAAFVKEHDRAPGLEVVLVGEDPASQIYTRNKEKAAAEVGIRGKLHVLPMDTTEADLMMLLDRLNTDETVDGILVQLPLPKQIREQKVLDAIRPEKDVDGFHPVNAGMLASGRPALVPCTPRGSMKLIALSDRKVEGARAVVVGRSNIVGKPMAQLLLAANATVTMAHSRTTDLAGVCREADVLVVAVGKAELVRGDWVKPGAVVIDVGMNRLEMPGSSAGDTKRTKLVGDVAFDEAKEVAGFITPVPGGVGPMTIACLLENTLIAAQARVAGHNPAPLTRRG
jgi:methylenetetrahydrofolate dehydrogenase (NADP+) / methenyltetrahydrofolate cyclohydrolase